MVVRMVCASPAWAPQAMLAEVMERRSASCVPSEIAPGSSPRSQFRSIRFIGKCRRQLSHRLEFGGEKAHPCASSCASAQLEGGRKRGIQERNKVTRVLERVAPLRVKRAPGFGWTGGSVDGPDLRCC